jgi:hypothetical protein
VAEPVKESNMPAPIVVPAIAAGVGALARNVAKKAAEQKVTYAVKYVENPKYKGEIMMYPKSFLDLYFKLDVNDDLPF